MDKQQSSFRISGHGDQTIYSVPRQFDLATVFVVSLAYALLFATMRTRQVPLGVFVFVTAFVTIIGAAQALLFGGKRPRLASMVAGVAIYVVAVTYMCLTQFRTTAVEPVVFQLSMNAILGTFLGYLAGTIVGGIFLVAHVARRLNRVLTTRATRPAKPSSV